MAMEGKPFDALDEKLQELVNAAFDMKGCAYCPYSNFHVGCAVLTESGEVYAGCNVENASYGLSICAERVAMTNALSKGHRKFRAAAVSCDVVDTFKGPCGACRQFFIEFGLDWDLYMVKPDKTWMKMQMGELVPLPFTPASLQEERVK
ncbi:cytidine deaminase-like [Haliotis rufescens]|uniref:cytidine deaminase-like n=1 Tax=Haliotis rufescens TaxID=6454 RepID=UPI00201F5643|nr:cytidine deaminase-like [Haliotis rufescens]